MNEYLKWDKCERKCAWDFNCPICPRDDCPAKKRIKKVKNGDSNMHSSMSGVQES